MKELDRPNSRGGKHKKSLVLEAFEQHQGSIKHFISRFLFRKQDIDDLAQETFLRAYMAERKKEIQQPKSYLFRIARNLALTELSKKSHKITDYVGDLDDSAVHMNDELAASAEEQVMAEQSLGIYCDAVAQLPPQCRRVYLLRKVYGMKHREIAEYLGVSLSTVENHLFKAMHKCNHYIKERTQSPSGEKHQERGFNG